MVKVAKVDQGQFSRTSSRWIQEGVPFNLGAGRDVKLMHLYPLSPERARRSEQSRECVGLAPACRLQEKGPPICCGRYPS